MRDMTEKYQLNIINSDVIIYFIVSFEYILSRVNDIRYSAGFNMVRT